MNLPDVHHALDPDFDMTHAPCREVHPEDFYPGKGGSHAAKAVCGECPAQAECLSYALSLPESEDHGIWGGTAEWERRVMRRKARAS